MILNRPSRKICKDHLPVSVPKTLATVMKSQVNTTLRQMGMKPIIIWLEAVLLMIFQSVQLRRKRIAELMPF